ncbi:MAG TPA: NADH-quinone oxidoreductase subunit C [Spirochaetota bacterium]|nr:NADH-quinone oxidoreductase subunit C [Spirochaetota bacterium]
MNHSMKNQLLSLFTEIQIDIKKDNEMIINAAKNAIIGILSFCKSKGYEHLALVSCVDWIEQKKFELVYILSPYPEQEPEFSKKEKTNIILKTRIDREQPEIVSVINIFKNAEPYEREIHELFGINFNGHPRLTPLFLERTYKIPPFRKNFDTREYVKKVFDEIPFIDKKEASK